MVKDHRTGIDYSQAAAILDGDLDQLVEDYLRQESAEKAHFDA
jgi:protein subunit release factor A